MSAEPAVALPEPARTLSITEEGFCAWLGKAMPGHRIEYHRGDLLIDRSRTLGSFSETDRRELSAIANRALALAEEGRLCLVAEAPRRLRLQLRRGHRPAPAAGRRFQR